MDQRASVCRYEACCHRLAAVRLLYVGLQVLRLEAVIVHVGTNWLSRAGLALLLVGALLGVSVHVVSIAALMREGLAFKPKPRRRRSSSGSSVTDGYSSAGGLLPWMQRMVVPLAMAGLILETLSCAPSAALPYTRLMTVLLFLSIILLRDPFWDVLPQLGAAVALDFMAFLAALLTGRYDTPQRVLQHLVGSVAAAAAVVVLAPLYNAWVPPEPPLPPPAPLLLDPGAEAGPQAAEGAPREAQHHQQGQDSSRSQHLPGDSGSTVSSLPSRAPCRTAAAADAYGSDMTALERPLAVLPPDVIQCAERRLLPAYRRKVFIERVLSSVLLTYSALRGPAAFNPRAVSIVGLRSVGHYNAIANTVAAVVAVPLQRMRAAATLVSLAASSLLLLNGLLAHLSGQLYGQYAPAINATVTLVHALSQVTQLLVAPETQRRGGLVRMMAVLTINLLGNEDPWVAFLIQLVALLGVVAALDSALVRPAASSTVSHARGAGNASFAGGPAAVLQGLAARQNAALTAGGTGGDSIGGAAASAAAATLSSWMVLPSAASGVLAAEDSATAPTGVAAGPPTVAAAWAGAAAFTWGDWLPWCCYAIIACVGAGIYGSLSRGRHVSFYRLYRKFYLPATYGGAYVAVPVPPDEARRLQTASVEDLGPWPGAESQQSTGDQARAGGVEPVAEMPRRDRRQLGNRRSLSLSSMAGMAHGGPAAAASVAGEIVGFRAGRGIPYHSGGHRASVAAAAAVTAAAAAASTGQSQTGQPVDASIRSSSVASLQAAAAAAQGRRSFAATSAWVAREGGVDQRRASMGQGGGGGATAAAATALRDGAGERVPGPVHTASPLGVVAPQAIGTMGLSAAAGVVASGVSGGVGELEADHVMASQHAMSAVSVSGATDGSSGGDSDESGDEGGFDNERAALASALNLDEADIISGKIDLPRQLSKLAHMGGGSPTGQDLDRLMQQFGSNTSTNGNPAAVGSSSGAAGGERGGVPTHRGPSRRSSDITNVASTYLTYSVRSTYSGPPADRRGEVNSPNTAGQGLQQGGGGGGGASSNSGAGGGAGAGSFLESVAVSIASGSPPQSGRAGAGMDTVPFAGQRVARLRAAPMRASSDLAAARRFPTHLPHGPMAMHHPYIGPDPVAQGEHRLPRRSPSEVTYLGPRYRSTAAAAGQVWSGGGGGPPHGLPGVQGYQHGALALRSLPGGPHYPPIQQHVPWGAHLYGGGGPAGAVSRVALSQNRRQAPSRQGSRQYSTLTGSTGLALVGQNLITIGGSSGGPNHPYLLSSIPSPIISGTNTTLTITADRSAGLAAGSAVVGAIDDIASSFPFNTMLSTDPAEGDSFGVISSLEPVNGLRGGHGNGPGLPSGKAGAGGAGGTAASSGLPAHPSTMPGGSGDDDGGTAAQQHQQHHHRQQHEQQEQQEAAGPAGWPPYPRSPGQPQQRPPGQPHPLLSSSSSVYQLPMAPGSPVFSDGEPQMGASLSFREVIGSGAESYGNMSTAEASGSRAKARVSWSDMEAQRISKASAGTSGTTPIVNTRASSAAAADAAAAAVSGVGPGARSVVVTAAGSPRGGSLHAAMPDTAAGGNAAAGASLGVGRGEAHAAAPATAQSHAWQQQHQHHHHHHHHHRHHQQTQSSVDPRRPAYRPHPVHSTAPPPDSAWHRGSGEVSETSEAIVQEQLRAARELAAMWTSSSIGDVGSSQQSSLGPSSASPVMHAQHHGSRAVLPVPAGGSGPVGGQAGHLEVGPGRGLAVVQEVPEGELAAVLERQGSTRQRRLSQVIQPGRPGEGSETTMLRSGSRAQSAVTPVRSQSQHSFMLQVSGGSGRDDGAIATSVAPSSRFVAPTAAEDGSSGDATLAGNGAASGNTGALPPPALGSAAGGSVSSLFGGASTAMSFDNWATADDLAAMFLGPQMGGPGGGEGSNQRNGSGGSSSKRALAFKAPQGSPGQPAAGADQTGSPHVTPSYGRDSSAAGVGGGGMVSQLAPRVPIRNPSNLGRGGGMGSAGSSSPVSPFTGPVATALASALPSPAPAAPAGFLPPGAGGAPGGGGRADISIVLEHVAGASRGYPPHRGGEDGDGPAAAAGPPPLQQHQHQYQPRYHTHAQATGSGNWSSADRVAPLRSPSVPNMGRAQGRMLAHGCVRRTSSMGKSRLGSIPSSSSSSVAIPRAITSTSPSGITAAAGSARLPADPVPAHFSPFSGSQIPSPMTFSTRPGSTSPIDGNDPLDSYSHLPPMRSSQAQLAMALPSSSLRGSVVRGRGVPGAIVAGGVVGGGHNTIAKGLMEAGATVSGPAAWARDAMPVRRMPFRRSSLDERLFKQVVTARMLQTSSPIGHQPPRHRSRRRSVGSLVPQGYIPSRLSQDGKAVRAAVAAAAAPGAPAVVPDPRVGLASSRNRSPVADALGPRSSSSSQVPAAAVTHAGLLSAGAGAPLQPPMAVTRGGDAGARGAGGGSVDGTGPHNAPQGGQRASMAGSVGTAVTASTASLLSFADVALGGVNYF